MAGIHMKASLAVFERTVREEPSPYSSTLSIHSLHGRKPARGSNEITALRRPLQCVSWLGTLSAFTPLSLTPALSPLLLSIARTPFYSSSGGISASQTRLLFFHPAQRLSSSFGHHLVACVYRGGSNEKITMVYEAGGIGYC